MGGEIGTDHDFPGFLGLRQGTVSDLQTGIVQTTNYDLDLTTLFSVLGTLFLDGAAPRYQRSPFRKNGVVPARSQENRSFLAGASLTEVFASLSDSPSAVITALVHASASSV